MVKDIKNRISDNGYFQPLTLQEFNQLTPEEISKIKHLDLSGIATSVDDEHIKKISSQIQHLESLGLRGCTKLTDLNALAPLVRLQRLDLTGCNQIKIEGLAKVPDSIKQLNLPGCTGLDDRDIRELRGMLSGAEIVDKNGKIFSTREESRAAVRKPEQQRTPVQNVSNEGGSGSNNLLAAVKSGDSAAVRRILSGYGVNVNSTNINGENALQLAIRLGHHDIARMLRNAGAVDDMIVDNKDNLAQQIVEVVTTNTASDNLNNGNTDLHNLIMQDISLAIKLLPQLSQHVNTQNNLGQTPLHLAFHSLINLISTSPNTASPNNIGNTQTASTQATNIQTTSSQSASTQATSTNTTNAPVINTQPHSNQVIDIKSIVRDVIAARKHDGRFANHYELITGLLDYKANPYIKDNKGHTAWDLAMSVRNQHLINYHETPKTSCFLESAVKISSQQTKKLQIA
ncbi:MAG: Ankyrin repeat (3 copies) [Rickettsiaceae bacterium]|nr:Ankyrin repeat (3 copies) [Rickettsiaceae bacterium]